MGRKCCEVPPDCHVHTYCIYSDSADCHRHKIWGITSASPNTPCHTHDYEGATSCNDCHKHCYHGHTGKPECAFCGHTHCFGGKTSCEDGHKHRYEGRTGKDRRAGRYY